MKMLATLVFAAVAAASFAQCCPSKKVEAVSEDEFMRMAREMEMKAEGKMACCKSTAAKPIEKGEKGCCNAPAAPKPFKVFVVGEGYHFFGCEGSAGKGRTELMAAGRRVGAVQKVTRL
jgi:hypothetical protein